MGPFNHANATIGRAYGLLSMNLQGGSEPSVTYMGSQGNNYMYNSITFAENEERSPWEPFHVQHGYKPTDSTVSVWTGVRSTSYTLGVREKHWREHIRHLLRGMDPYIPPTLVLDPITARQFIDRGGFDTKERLIQWLHDNATMKAGEYWDYQLVMNYVHPRAVNGEEPWGTRLQAAEEQLIPLFRCRTSTWWSSAARLTATGGSWAATTARPSRWTPGVRRRPAGSSPVGVVREPPLPWSRRLGCRATLASPCLPT